MESVLKLLLYSFHWLTQRLLLLFRASKPERIAEDQAALKTVIPAAFWEEMREQKLVAVNAPLPINVK